MIFPLRKDKQKQKRQKFIMENKKPKISLRKESLQKTSLT